ncbi:MAG: hypothetical protein ACI37Q_03430 [Candidatus Gastranaerophilaceae bacterium]
MNETVIKEIKSIYSARIKSDNPAAITPEIQTIKPEKKDNKTFFNGVIDKLNIIVNK